MKRLTVLLVTAILFLSFMTVPALAEEKITLDFLHDFSESDRATNVECDVFHILMDEWQEANPDVELTDTGMYQADYATKVQAMAAAGDLPDLFMVKGSWYSMFVDNELVVPMTEYLNNYEYFDLYADGIFDPATIDGEIYGLPRQNAITHIVFYNKEMWAEAGYETFPETWEDFFAANEYFKEKGIYTVAMGNIDKWPCESCLISCLGDRFTGAEWSASIIAKDGVAKWTDQEFVDALALLQKMTAEGFFNPDYNTINNNQAQSLFLEGKAASTFEGYWAISNMEATAPDMLDNIGVALIPGVEGGKGKALSTSGGSGWFIGINSNLEGEKLEKAVDLAFALAGLHYSEVFTARSGMPGPMKVDAVDQSTFSPLTQAYLEASAEWAYTPIYDIAMEAVVIDVLNNGLQEIMNGTMTPEDLAADMQFEQDNL